MKKDGAEALTEKSSAVANWHAMLRDDVALLARPGAHHKTLLRHAHALHQIHVIDADDLSDFLELADGALAFAVEALLDINPDE
jgi:hypothetical protein